MEPSSIRLSNNLKDDIFNLENIFYTLISWFWWDTLIFNRIFIQFSKLLCIMYCVLCIMYYVLCIANAALGIVVNMINSFSIKFICKNKYLTWFNWNMNKWFCLIILKTNKSLATDASMKQIHPKFVITICNLP